MTISFIKLDTLLNIIINECLSKVIVLSGEKGTKFYQHLKMSESKDAEEGKTLSKKMKL